MRGVSDRPDLQPSTVEWALHPECNRILTSLAKAHGRRKGTEAGVELRKLRELIIMWRIHVPVNVCVDGGEGGGTHTRRRRNPRTKPSVA